MLMADLGILPVTRPGTRDNGKCHIVVRAIYRDQAAIDRIAE